MGSKIGVVTSTYVNFSMEQALAGISESGFKYVELATIPGIIDHILPRPEEMKDINIYRILDICKNQGLEIYCIAAHERLMKENAVNNFKKVIDTAKLLGVKYITTDTGRVNTEEDRKRFYKEMKILGDYAGNRDIILCLETHGDWCNNGKIASEIIKNINYANIKVNYDTANVIFYGDTNPEKDLEYALPYIGFIHLKDKKGGYKVWNFPALGEGEINFDRIFKLVKNYNGPISVEVEFDGNKHPLDEINDALKKSYIFLEDYGLIG